MMKRLRSNETIEYLSKQMLATVLQHLTIDELNKELDKAVANEDYEKAAKLRDEISKRN